MKCNSENDLKISISEIQIVKTCCVCQDHSTSLTLVEKAFIGEPPILLSDLLLQCFDSMDKYQLIVGEDPSNNYICDSCVKSLEEYYNAVQSVSIKRNEFLSRVQDKTNTPDGVEYFVIIESLEKNSNSSDLPTKHVINEESNSHHSDDEFVKIINSDDEYIALNSSEDEFVKVIQPIENFEDEWSSDCSINSNGRETTEHLRKSLITIERMPRTKFRFCWRCDKNFPSDDAFEIHLKLIHTKSKKTIYSCQQCQKSFPSEDEHNAHLSKVHYSDQLRCEICGASLASSVLLKTHKMTHEELKCSICSKMMSTRRMLQRHMMTHRMDKKHQCLECGNKYISKAFLQKHMLIHKDVRSHICQIVMVH
ncbi:zinc finger protein 431-like [Zeugodacus cucurbitae]|uniref:zinc finger protein 431-like n=1 Tax=Zeugodacus cucurbitae TaxID=28588 RepID=UPI0005968396|nr:zinc finger protein 431-like [Zeugodacus cucurbitae]